MDERECKKHQLMYVVCAFFSSLSFCITNDTYILTEEQMQQFGSQLEIWCWKFLAALNHPTYMICMMGVLLFFAYRYIGSKWDRKYLYWGIPLSGVSSLIVLLCESYYTTNSWDKVFGNTTALILSILRGLGIGILFLFIYGYIQTISLYEETRDRENVSSYKLFFKIMVVLFVCWIPYMIVLFPGCMNGDTRDQFAQILGNVDLCWSAESIVLKSPNVLLNNHHPVFYTFILSIFIKLGDLIGSHSWALEIYCILQSLCMAALFAAFLIYMRKKNVPKTFCKLTLLFFAFNPVIPIHGMTIMKDIPFAMFTLIASVMLYEILTRPDKGTFKYGLLFMAVLLIWMLLRNNGFYILILLIPFVICILWKNKKYMKKVICFFIVPMLIFQIGIQGILFSEMNITSGSVREMLSVPFQQTARYVQEYGDTLSEEEEEIILKIFSTPNNAIEDLSELYIPERSDSIKNMYNKEASKDDMKKYAKVWMKGLISHPDVYVEAFLNLNYGWFTFENKHDTVYYNGIIDIYLQEVLPDVKNPDSLNGARNVLKYCVTILDSIPFTAWLTDFSFYTWAYLLSFIIMIVRKRYKELAAVGILYINYLICFIGPVAYMRYAIPMVVCFPFLLMLTFFDRNKNSITESLEADK